MSLPVRRIAGTIFERRERWGLTWRGRLLVGLMFAITAAIYVTQVFPFFSVTHRVEARTLVVEGWVHDYAIRAAVAEYKSGGYEKIYTTGGPVQGTGQYTNDFNTAASVAAERLIAAGISSDLVQMVPSHVTDRERTYSSALALRSWLIANRKPLDAINIITEDLHSRRTWLLFQKALGHDVKVGIISIPNSDYDPAEWWKYSEGIQEVLRETLAYVYVKMFFHPPAPSNELTGHSSMHLHEN